MSVTPNHGTPVSLPPLHGDFELAGSKVTGNSLVSFLRHSDAFLQMLERETSQTLLGLIEPLLIFHSLFPSFSWQPSSR